MDDVDALKEELAACEADLVLWKVRLSRAKRRELVKAPSIAATGAEIATERGPQVQAHDKKITSPHATSAKEREDVQEKRAEEAQAQKTEEAQAKRVEDLEEKDEEVKRTQELQKAAEVKKAEERKQLLLKLREEKAKAARREKIAELEKAAREALKKQRIAREQLEKANQRVLPPPIRTTTSVKRQLPTVPRHAKRLQTDTPKALEIEMMTLPKAQSLPLETTNDLLSHVFRVCTRHLLQRNKMLSVAQLQVLCQDYFGTEFGVAAKSVGASSDFASFLSSFPFFDAVVSDNKSTACTPPLGESLLPQVVCSTPEMLAHFLMASREHINNVLQLTTQLSSSKDKEGLLDLLRVCISMYMASPASSLLEQCWPLELNAPDCVKPALVLFASVQSQMSYQQADFNRKTSKQKPFAIAQDSPLLSMRTFRFQPAFSVLFPGTSILTNTYTHALDPMKVLCPYEMHGVCNDDQCTFQHEQDYTISAEMAIKDLGNVYPIASGENPEEQATQWVKELQNTTDSVSELLFLRSPRALLKANQKPKWMEFVQSAVALRKFAYEMGLDYLDEDESVTPVKSPVAQQISTEEAEELSSQLDESNDFLRLPSSESAETSNAQRYFARDNILQAIQELEKQVALNPEDADAWISLALMQLDVDLPLQQDDIGSISSDGHIRNVLQVLHTRIYTRQWNELSLEKTLHILSRALEVEANVYNETVWRLYLALFPEDAGRQELAQEALRFIPSSASLWLEYLQIYRFESVSVAQVIYYRAIEKILHHSKSQEGVHATVYTITVQLCQLYLDSGHPIEAETLLASLLVSEKSASKPLCFGAFKFAAPYYCQLWMVYLHIYLLGTLPESVLTKDDPLLWLFQSPTLPFQLKRSLPSVESFFSEAEKEIPRESVFHCVVLLNHITVLHWMKSTIDPKLLEVLDQVVDIVDSATLLHWIPQHLEKLGLSFPPEKRRFTEHAWRFLNKDMSEIAIDGDSPEHWAERGLQSWMDHPGNVFEGLFYFEYLAQVTGIAIATKHYDSFLQRSAFGQFSPQDQHWCWCFRLQLEIRLGTMDSCEAVWRRYLVFTESFSIPPSTVSAAVTWCLTPPRHSLELKFTMFQLLLQSIPASLKATFFARYTHLLGSYPPFLLAFSKTSLNERQRNQLKNATKACLERYRGHSALLTLAVQLELDPLPNKSSMHKVKALVRSAIQSNPIAIAPWRLALSVEIVLGKQKSYDDVSLWFVAMLKDRGMNLCLNERSWAQASSLNLSGRQLLSIPPSLSMLHQLQELDLSRNCLVELPEALCRSLPHLTMLNLSFNSLVRLPDAIGQLKQLEYLNVAHNHLQELPLLVGHLQQLVELHLSHNMLRCLPVTLRGLRALEHLFVVGNPVPAHLVQPVVPPTCQVDVERRCCSVCADEAKKILRLDGAPMCPKCIVKAVVPLL